MKLSKQYKWIWPVWLLMFVCITLPMVLLGMLARSVSMGLVIGYRMINILSGDYDE